jgi:hypothetical protein
MAVELRNMLTTELGLSHTLPATLIFDYPNVEAIAEYLASRILALDDASHETLPIDGWPDAAGNRGGFRAGPGQIEDLSDEEVEKLLAEKLGAM